MVQHRAAKFVLSNYDQLVSVTQMLNSIGWSTMKQRCGNLRVIKSSMNQLKSPVVAYYTH